jgi:hypothetical protein
MLPYKIQLQATFYNQGSSNDSLVFVYLSQIIRCHSVIFGINMFLNFLASLLPLLQIGQYQSYLWTLCIWAYAICGFG